MAILQLTLANVHDEINLRVYGSVAPINSLGDALLTRRVNMYLQGLGKRTAHVLQGDWIIRSHIL